MDLAIIDKAGLSEFISELLQDEAEVIGVKEQRSLSGIPGDRGFYTYAPLNAPDELDLSFDLTLIPPKKYLQPVFEELFSFNLPAGEFSQTGAPDRGQILFGVHPYDILAINQMDKVFSATPRDTHYLERRSRTAIIGIYPVNVASRAFWSSMGAHEVKTGFDLMLTDIGERYTVETGSEMGAALLRKARGRDAGMAEKRERDRVRARARKLCDSNRLSFPFLELPDLLKRNQDNPLWEEKSRLCFSCGTCNLVCPTCYCFDIRDGVSMDLKKGRRYRTWDGCLFADFAKVAGGANFRAHRADRYRHRFLRKGLFIYERFGDIGCVGCGRCSIQCPSDIADPVEVYNRLKEGIRSPLSVRT
ncbi:MAG: 4Fe-4S dicluster domain-containing protein [Pseudomonadota bacterium]